MKSSQLLLILALTSFKWNVGDAVAIHRRARHGPVDYSRGVAHLREAESFWSAETWKSARERVQKGKTGELNA